MFNTSVRTNIDEQAAQIIVRLHIGFIYLTSALMSESDLIFYRQQSSVSAVCDVSAMHTSLFVQWQIHVLPSINAVRADDIAWMI